MSPPHARSFRMKCLIMFFRFAKNFTMPEGRGGKISHRLEPQNQGLRNQWFQACYPANNDGSYCLILEDDLELSPFWFTWLRKAWLKYGDREDIAGITLSVSYIKSNCITFRI